MCATLDAPEYINGMANYHARIATIDHPTVAGGVVLRAQLDHPNRAPRYEIQPDTPGSEPVWLPHNDLVVVASALRTTVEDMTAARAETGPPLLLDEAVLTVRDVGVTVPGPDGQPTARTRPTGAADPLLDPEAHQPAARYQLAIRPPLPPDLTQPPAPRPLLRPGRDRSPSEAGRDGPAPGSPPPLTATVADCRRRHPTPGCGPGPTPAGRVPVRADDREDDSHGDSGDRPDEPGERGDWRAVTPARYRWRTMSVAVTAAMTPDRRLPAMATTPNVSFPLAPFPLALCPPGAAARGGRA